MATEPLLRIRNMSAFYGAITAVRDVDIEVPPGSIVTLLGANGAGKSTILRAVSNAVRSEGSIAFKGRSIRGLQSDAVARLGIAHVPEGREVFPYLSVSENLLMGTFACRDRQFIEDDLAAVYSYFPVLKERAHQSAASLSGGEQQMLVIGRAMVSRPELILLDEPSLGLSPRLMKEIFQIIVRISLERGAGILLVEQNAKFALRVSSYGYVLETGRIVAADQSARLLESPKVRDAYLGGQ